MKQSTSTADRSVTVEQPTPLSKLVVDAVADAEGVDALDLDPLYGAVDPDALDALFRLGDGPTSEPPTGEVTFPYEGYRVRVTAAGRVELAEE